MAYTFFITAKINSMHTLTISVIACWSMVASFKTLAPKRSSSKESITELSLEKSLGELTSIIADTRDFASIQLSASSDLYDSQANE